MRVFLSYAQQDLADADALKRALSKAGESVWSDKEILGGEDWDSSIQRALRDSNVVLTLVTPASLSSQYVNYEIGSAIGANVPVVPVLLREVESLPGHLRQTPAIDVRGLDSTTIGTKVAAAIKKIPQHNN